MQATQSRLAEEERKALVSQIPTGGMPGAGPTPQPDPTQSASGTELGRNVRNTISALAPLSGGTSLVNGASRLGTALGMSPAAGRAASGIAQVAPYAVPIAGMGALAAASSPSQPEPQAAPLAAPAIGAQPTSTQTAIEPVAQASDTSTAPIGKPVGFGATRIDQPGKSPLFTNLSGEAGAADNAALMGRGAISAQNMGAATALSDRYGMEARNTAQGQINKERYDAEVAQAQQINAAGRRLNLEYAAANGKTGLERKAARASLDSLDKVAAGDQAAKTDKYRVDSAAKGQAAQTASQDKRYADANAIAQSQLGMTRAESQMKLDQAKQLQAAQAEYLGAKTPEERQAAERKLLVLGGKQQSPDEYAYAPGGQQVIDGQTVTQPGVIFNKRTGQQAGGAQQKPAQTFETNKVYTDAKGNRAKWDGKTFVPA